ncbi:MAG TPA: TetR/AcrR family transcriptional regulator [Acidimicrobiales bacterium]|nr:TetR/AcrR family transcriptional regulator [Acidimicrobiales bacterium]
MPALTGAERLPRGRHDLSREEVEASQRARLLMALATAMTEKGYVGTSVADVLKRSGVGRETFYQLFSSKLDCFMQAFDAAGELLLHRIEEAAVEAEGTPLERFEHAFGTYLDILAEQPALARVFLVEVYAAGPEALARRAALQERIVDRLALLLDARHEGDRFACQVLVAAVGSLVTTPLLTDDTAALRALRTKVVGLVRAILATRE